MSGEDLVEDCLSITQYGDTHAHTHARAQLSSENFDVKKNLGRVFFFFRAPLSCQSTSLLSAVLHAEVFSFVFFSPLICSSFFL